MTIIQKTYYCRQDSGTEKPFNTTKLWAGGLVFLFLTVGVFWYQFACHEPYKLMMLWDQLRWKYLILMIIFLPADTLAGSLRIWVVSRALMANISYWTCLKAEWANLGVSMLTPSQTGGGVGQIYVLKRGGATIESALIISLISFLGSIAGLLCIGLYCLLFSGIGQMGLLFKSAVVMFTAVTALLVLPATCPRLLQKVIFFGSRVIRKTLGNGLFTTGLIPIREAGNRSHHETPGPIAIRLAGFVHACHRDVSRFFRLKQTGFLWVYLLSLAFLFSRGFMAFLCLRFLGIQASNLGHIFEIQLLVIFLVYFAPTPGGSVLAEGVSLLTMSHIVPLGLVPYYNLLWRSTTFYLPAIAGLGVMLHALVQDAQRLMGRINPNRREYHG